MTKKISTPFAINSTKRNDVPVTTTTAGKASYNVGFPAENFISLASGGIAPSGEDFNGVLYDITSNISDINKGLPQYFDTDFSALINGYPLGARVCLNDNSGYVVSTVANNTQDPNLGMSGWNRLDYHSYDFKVAQPIQYYYDILGDWDKAIYQAQANVYLKNFSTTLVFPFGTIEIKKPILLNEALLFNLNKDYPELGLYNEATGTFGGKDGKDNNYYTTPWRIIGQGKPAQIGEGYNSSKTTNMGIGGGTTLSFVGGKSIDDDPTDMTYMNYGIIHCAPEFGGVQDAVPSDYFNNKDDLSGFNRIEIRDIGILGNSRNIHGVVIWRSHWHLLSDVWIDDCYGAGLFMNWLYDLNIDRTVFTKCGRMSPNYQTFITDKLFDVQYQTYAPLHITAQNPIKGDNSNYLGVFRPHFENNFRCVSDVIVNGNTNPIWFTNAHHETRTPAVSTGTKLKVAYTAGNYGVKYFGIDSESSFDYKNQSWNEAGAYITIRDCYGYTDEYSHLAVVSRFSELNVNNFDFSKDIYINGGNANANLKISDSIVGNISADGGFSNNFPVEIYNSNCASFTCNYLNNLKLVNSSFGNGITLNNVNLNGTWKGSLISKVATTSISGDLRGGTIEDISFTDNTQQALINSGGAISTISDSTYFETWLVS